VQDEGRTSTSASMIAWMREELKRRPHSSVTFCEYMEWCLYHPEFGYYTKERVKLGKEGDFYTSASLGGLMGETLASYVLAELGQNAGEVSLVEWGGGNGQMARDVLQELQRLDSAFYQRLHYISVETSPFHRRLQEEQLALHKEKVCWMSEEEFKKAGPWRSTLIYSNELPDAFPVHKAVYQGGAWQEIYVGWDEADGCLTERMEPLLEGPVAEYIHRYQLPEREGQQIEVNLAAEQWLHELSSSLEQGTILTIDYGDVSEELYAAHRMKGTLLCYRRHQASDTPLLYPGEQDMTTHVHFSALIRAGEEGGMTSQRLLTQKQFLLENGLLDKLQGHDARDPFSAAAKRNRAIRQLLLSDSMSELFKVLIQKKGELR
jgi:SAM-dependent MidA family methyltransferase